LKYDGDVELPADKARIRYKKDTIPRGGYGTELRVEYCTKPKATRESGAVPNLRLPSL
jgi:hypothetical protein